MPMKPGYWHYLYWSIVILTMTVRQGTSHVANLNVLQRGSFCQVICTSYDHTINRRTMDNGVHTNTQGPIKGAHEGFTIMAVNSKLRLQFIAISDIRIILFRFARLFIRRPPSPIAVVFYNLRSCAVKDSCDVAFPVLRGMWLYAWQRRSQGKVGQGGELGWLTGPSDPPARDAGLAKSGNPLLEKKKIWVTSQQL